METIISQRNKDETSVGRRSSHSKSKHGFVLSVIVIENLLTPITGIYTNYSKIQRTEMVLTSRFQTTTHLHPVD